MPTNDSWRVDETYIKIKDQWVYLYRAVDFDGNTVEFMLQRLLIAFPETPCQPSVSSESSACQDTTPPRVINGDNNPSYPKAVSKLQKKGTSQRVRTAASQIQGKTRGDIRSQVIFVFAAFGLAA